jgi:hypothetical protein
MPNLPTAVQQANRFQVRWANGYWKIFDTWRYCAVDIFDLKKDADNALAV